MSVANLLKNPDLKNGRMMDAVEIFQAILEATDIEEDKYHLNLSQRFSCIFLVREQETVKFKDGPDGKSCRYCGTEFRVTHDTLSVLTLPLDPAYDTTQQLLTKSLFTQEQKDPRKCPNEHCEKPGIVIVQPTLTTLPPILATQILRFSTTGRREISSSETLTVQGVPFQLRSVVNHLNGHYTAHVKEKSGWTEYNDKKLPVALGTMLPKSRTNYLLFHSKLSFSQPHIWSSSGK